MLSSSAVGAITDNALLNQIYALSQHELTEQEMIQQGALCLQEHAGCDAVGVRLLSEGDYPYVYSQGFSDGFIRREKSLIRRNALGQVMRNGRGQPRLDCMCGAVISGDVDANLPFFSDRGSFWTPSTTELLQAHNSSRWILDARGVCHHQGYESVALIPLRNGTRALGLLQLNHEQRDCFFDARISLYEQVGDLLSLGLSLRRNRLSMQQHRDAVLEATVESLPFDFFAIDADGRYMLQNSHCRRRWGDVIGRRPEEMEVEPKLKQIWLENNRRAFAGETVTGEVEYQFDGKRCWYHNIISPIYSKDRISGILGINIDITDRKLAEEKSVEMARQLGHAQKMEAVGTLAGGVAHDFNNILTSIGSMTNVLLVDAAPDSRLFEDLQLINRSVERGAQLTQLLLGFSRTQELQLKRTELNRLIDETQAMLRRLLREDIRLELTLDKRALWADVDPHQITQALINLAINAQDAMPDGGTLRFGSSQLQAVDEEGLPQGLAGPAERYARLTVSDTGHGMAPEEQQRIFEPFYTTKDRATNSGLGLSMVHGVIRQNLGSVHVESELGRGTCFTLYLPLVEPPAEGAAIEQPPSELRVGSETILLVEDDEMVRKVITRVLQMQGYRVLATQDGESAMQRLRGHRGPLHLVISDLIMPGMSGKQLHAELRDDGICCPVIFISGHASHVLGQTGILDSRVSFLKKPFKNVEILRLVQKVLDES